MSPNVPGFKRSLLAPEVPLGSRDLLEVSANVRSGKRSFLVLPEAETLLCTNLHRFAPWAQRC